MGVPSSRTPVRVARGTYANLSTTNALAALQEGEICFATDQDRLYVKEGAGLTSISASSTTSPAPSNITASPAFASGTGTQADPFVVTSAAVPFSGGTAESAQEITLTGTAGDFVIFTDNSVSASGNRFSGQDVGNINSGGTFKFKLKYEDTPGTTVNNTTYNGLVQIGTAHFSFTVVQSNLTALSQSAATTIAGTGGAGNVFTCTPGTATGGTGTITYATQWQRSFNGIDGFFDIAGATSNTYTQTNSDAGNYVRAVVTATDATPAGQGGPLTLALPSSVSAQIPSGAAPVINNVVLSEDNTSGARFTSKVFSADVTMNNDGSPVSQKGVKGTVLASFTVPSTTSALTSYNNSVTTNVFTTSYTQNALSNVQDYAKSWYVNVEEYNDDHRLLEFHQRGSNFYIYAVNSDGSRGSQLRYYSIGGSTPYMQNTQMINRNGLLSFHGVQRSSFEHQHHLFCLRANDLTGSDIGPSTGYNTSTTDGHLLWYFNSGRKLQVAYNASDTTNYSLTQGISGYNTDDDWNQYHTSMAENYRGGFAYIEASDELVLIWHISNYIRMDRWKINRQSGTTPGNWNVQRQATNQAKFQCSQLHGTWDLGSAGFWMIVTETSGGYAIYKYNDSTKNLDKKSNMPSAIGGQYERFGMGVDGDGNIQLSGMSSNSTSTMQKVRSTNGGASWQSLGTVSNPSGYNVWNTNYATTGDTEIWGFVSEASSGQTGTRPFRRFSNQTATVTNASLTVFGDSEKITKQGDENNQAYKGTMEITNRTNGNVKLLTSGLWQNGDVVVSRVGGNTQTATKYLVINSVGSVTDISSTDPGYTTLGPGTAIDLTFPATFPSGNAPDTELASGAAMQVTVQATNTAASDTFTSNTVTPT